MVGLLGRLGNTYWSVFEHVHKYTLIVIPKSENLSYIHHPTYNLERLSVAVRRRRSSVRDAACACFVLAVVSGSRRSRRQGARLLRTPNSRKRREGVTSQDPHAPTDLHTYALQARFRLQ